MDREETKLYFDILVGEQKPRQIPFAAGFDAHGARTPFHRNPYGHTGVDSLSWRLGWHAGARISNDGTHQK